MFVLLLPKFSVRGEAPEGSPILETGNLRVDRGDKATCLESIPTLQMG